MPSSAISSAIRKSCSGWDYETLNSQHSTLNQVFNMPFFDRRQLDIRPLVERKNDLRIAEIAYRPGQPAPQLSAVAQEQVQRIADRVRMAISAGRPVVLTYGAH